MIDINSLLTTPFYEMTALLVLAAVVGFIGLLMRQPMIVSFIAVGILAGPSALGIVQSDANVDLLAELGIALLLFLVGLKLDLKLIRTMGVVSLATGLGQVAFTSIIGYFIALALGMSTITALYVAVALTFSSTIIIVKLLSDKKEVDSLHGRIAIGFLIVQDLVVVIAMMVLSAFGVSSDAGPDDSVLTKILTTVAYGLGMLVLTGIFMRYIATPLMNRVARSSELVVIFAICWATLLAAIGHYLGFSKELGGLLAGISLASTPFREAIVARLSSLRDFLLLFFFISLGSQLEMSLLGAQVYPALLFSLFVLIGNPLIVMVIMGSMGYRKRTGFLAGLTVAQISEFSLIFMAMGLSLGHVTADSLGLVTLTGLITIALSVYMITYSHSLYNFLEPALGYFERRHPWREEEANRQQVDKQDFDIILFGLGRYGSMIAECLAKEGYKFLGVDFNPDVVKRWQRDGYSALYGDVSDPDFFEMLPLNSAKWVISAIPQHDLGLTHEDPRLLLINALKEHHFTGMIGVSTQNPAEVAILTDKGADIVFLPFQDAAYHAVEKLKKLDKSSSRE
jgi:Kef-type K+ transport system membrane component KefB